MWPILVIVHPQTALGALRSHGATPQGAGGRPASTRGDPPGERKIDNKTRIVLLDAFVGRCGGIARRENGAGFVQFGSACADNVRRAPPGAACASIFFLNKHFFTKTIQLQTTSRGRYRPAVHPQRRRRRRRRRSPPAGRRPPTTDRRPPTADRPAAGRPSAPQADVTDLDAEGVLTVVAKRSNGARSMPLTISLPSVRACCESGRTSASDEPRDLIGQHPTRTILVTMRRQMSRRRRRH